MRASALSPEIRIFETLMVEKPGFFLNADALIEDVRIKETPVFSIGRVSKNRIFRLNADTLNDRDVEIKKG